MHRRSPDTHGSWRPRTPSLSSRQRGTCWSRRRVTPRPRQSLRACGGGVCATKQRGTSRRQRRGGRALPKSERRSILNTLRRELPGGPRRVRAPGRSHPRSKAPTTPLRGKRCYTSTSLVSN
ncbi:hypothetical protein NDU88_000826 [Pleurodeles waltl]|uniref:Uncharacterized protein n=1 Tax=Pleurodeles waltl TaxID=8319 RepID=A0AAV7P5B1_PLEWA|nr:hypothetical protein NDU88_000826 [Pleurodeles waltl]